MNQNNPKNRRILNCERGLLNLLPFCLLLIFTSCGYRWQHCDSLYNKENAVTISIPYIRGDKEGELTTALSLSIGKTPCFEYRKDQGTLELLVKITADEGGVIGYRYDRDPKTGTLRPNILSTESRRTITASVTLVDTRSDLTLIGPFSVTSSQDFDFVESSSIYDLTFTPPGGAPQTVIDFSLGQLDAIDGANDDVRTPIYDDLSQKIVSTLVNLYTQ